MRKSQLIGGVTNVTAKEIASGPDDTEEAIGRPALNRNIAFTFRKPDVAPGIKRETVGPPDRGRGFHFRDTVRHQMKRRNTVMTDISEIEHSGTFNHAGRREGIPRFCHDVAGPVMGAKTAIPKNMSRNRINLGFNERREVERAAVF